ncbi:hypothetical protein DSCW_34130 [Desulfosarcina widdelii]|uniref:Uncharacterized protein n=1 Tax=Desulfosarcina widdelii TaxID=947919 RepID=A0A5K7Z2Q0_9BACT|nr:hypothetical protein DSCW_34130 [Desulfosarcina widdelii]
MNDTRKKDPAMNGGYKLPKDTPAPSNEQGICLNCEDRQLCCFSDAGKNVVYCEEHFSDHPDEEKKGRPTHNFEVRPCFRITDIIPLC